jgi:hypothetical protein
MGVLCQGMLIIPDRVIVGLGHMIVITMPTFKI